MVEDIESKRILTPLDNSALFGSIIISHFKLRKTDSVSAILETCFATSYLIKSVINQFYLIVEPDSNSYGPFLCILQQKISLKIKIEAEDI